jgi:hypothetical protein
MRCRSRASAWLLVAAGQCLLAASRAQTPEAASGPGFFAAHPVLQFIEQRLPAATTLVVPPAPDRQVATDLELRAAFVAVLDDFLAPPATFAGKAGDLIEAVCRYRPAHGPPWVAVATAAILRHAPEGENAELNRAVAAAIAANPAEAGAVAAAALQRIAAFADEKARAASGAAELEKAEHLAGRVLAAAIGAVKTRPGAGPAIRRLVEQAVQTALAAQRPGLLVEMLAAAVTASAGVEGVTAPELARQSLVQFGTTKQQAGLICAGILRGTGRDAVSAIRDEAALNLPVPFAAYTNIVCTAFVAAAAVPAAAPQEVSRFIRGANADFIPAVMIGAIAASPERAAETLQAGLNRDLALHGRATTREIVEAAVLACAAHAPELAAAAVGHGDLMEENSPAQIAEGLARGAPPAFLGGALAAQIRAQQNSPAEIKATVAGAVAGVLATDKLGALGTVAGVAVAGSGHGAEVLEQMLVSAPSELQYAGVLAVLAADRAAAEVLLDRALHHAGLAAGQARPIAEGGGLILEIQAQPAAFFRAAVRRLHDPENAAPHVVEAIVLGAALANPRGAGPVAAAALAVAGASSKNLIATAVQGAPQAEAAIREAVAAAFEARRAPADSLSQWQRELPNRRAAAPDRLAGALAAVPALGPVAGYAGALAAPAAVAQIVPRLFAFSTVRNPEAVPPEAPPEALAALTAAVVRGLLAAHLDAPSESRAVAEAVAAAVKSVAACARDATAAPAVPEAATIAAVVTAAARVANPHALAIARIAARTTRALSCPGVTAEMLRDAILAAGAAADVPKIADAIGAGFAEADAQIPAANARRLVDDARDSLTGTPMTHYLDY